MRNNFCHSRDHFYVEIVKWVKRNKSFRVWTILDNKRVEEVKLFEINNLVKAKFLHITSTPDYFSPDDELLYSSLFFFLHPGPSSGAFQHGGSILASHDSQNVEQISHGTRLTVTGLP